MSHLHRNYVPAFRATVVAMLGFLILLLAACNVVPQNGAPAEAVTTLTTQGDDGLVLIRAASFATNVPRGAYTWTLQKDLASVNGEAMLALPDTMTTLDKKLETLSPRLDYRVNFKKAGTYYVWVYGRAADKAPLNGDSLHVGLNGKVVTSSSRLTNLPATYGWANKTMAGRIATLPISSPGTYTVNVWMREDGARFGALVLSPDTRFLPSATTLSTPSQSPPTPESGLTPTPPINFSPEHVAFSAAALRNSVGVNIHSLYDDTAYYDTKRLLAYLKELNPTWVREGVHQNPRPWHPGFLRDLKQAGFKITAGIGDPAGTYGNFGIGDSQSLLKSLKTTYKGLYDQLEMPNEWDLFSPTGNWVPELNAFYNEYYSAIHNDPELKSVRILGPSFGTYDGSSHFSKSADAANLHPYAGGTIPENNDIARAVEGAKRQSATGKVVATELGYHNAVNTDSGHRGVPEDIVAHYMVRMLVWNYLQGIDQSYIYQLFDQKPTDPRKREMEEWFGLVAVEGSPAQTAMRSWTLRKKPAFYAIQRFLAYLQDEGSATLPETLPFEVAGAPQNAIIVPVARHDGSYDVAIWLTNNLWERNSRKALADVSATVQFRFASSVSVSSFRPSVSDTVTQIASGITELSVLIDGKVTFFRVRPY